MMASVMSQFALKPNEFVVRVEENEKEVTYCLLQPLHDYDSKALNHIAGALLALSKLRIRKRNTIINETIDDDSDLECDA